MDTRLLVIDQQTECLNEALQLRPSLALEFQTRLEMSLIYHDNALEGVVFSGSELMSALDPLALPPDSSMALVYTAIRNHKAAIDFIRAEASNKKTKLSLAMLKRLHEILGSQLESRDKSLYRKEMPLHRSYFHDIAQPNKIASLLEKLFEQTTEAEFRESHPLLQAATLHWQLMQAFPFTENSGKTARLMAQFVLLREGMLPVVIHSIDRQRYYESLRLPVPALRSLLLDAMENSLENAFKVVQAAPPELRPAASEPRGGKKSAAAKAKKASPTRAKKPSAPAAKPASAPARKRASAPAVEGASTPAPKRASGRR